MNQVFVIPKEKIKNRLDCKTYDPNMVKPVVKDNNDNFVVVNLNNKIAKVTGGKRLPKGYVNIEEDPKNVIPYIRIEDISNMNIDFKSSMKIDIETHNLIKKYQLKSGDIVLSTVGTIGEVAVVPEHVDICNFTENMAKIEVVNKNVNKEYLAFFLISKFGNHQIYREYVGSLQYKLSLDSIRKRIDIVFPVKNGIINYEKQKELVDEINFELIKQEELRNKIQSQINQLNSIIETELKLENKIISPEKAFVISKIEDTRFDCLYNNPNRYKLLYELKKNNAKPLSKFLIKNTKKFSKIMAEYKVVDLENVDFQTGKIINCKYLVSLNSDKIELKSNSIIISKMFTDKLKIAIVPDEFSDSAASTEFIQYKVENINTKFLWATLRTNYVKNQWEYKITGSSRMRINDSIIKNTLILVPDDIKKQEEIVCKIEEIEDKIKKLNSEIKNLTNIIDEKFELFFNR